MASTHIRTVLRTDSIAARVLAVSAFAVGTALCAQISFHLWFSPVPVTLQVLAVILSGLVLGSKLGALSQLQYLAMGAAGLPVFANFSGGPIAFAGPSGGYLLGFVPGAFITGWVFERFARKTGLGTWIGGIAGIAVVYLFGASWLAVWLCSTTRQPMSACINNAWALGVVPFIGVDLLKTAAASSLALGGRWGQGMISALRGDGAKE